MIVTRLTIEDIANTAVKPCSTVASTPSNIVRERSLAHGSNIQNINKRENAPQASTYNYRAAATIFYPGVISPGTISATWELAYSKHKRNDVEPSGKEVV